jgi:hypothetical protein
MKLVRGIGDCDLVFPYGQLTGANAVTIFAKGHEPVVGAFGSEGAKALTGKLNQGLDPVQSNTKG